MFYVLLIICAFVALDNPIVAFGMFVAGCLFIVSISALVVRSEALKARHLELQVRELELKVKD